MSVNLNSLLASGLDDFEDPQEDESTPPEQTEMVETGTDVLTQPVDAERKNYAIPPRLVEDVQRDPEKIRPIARSMMAVNLHNLFKKIQHPATNAKDRLEFQAMLNKMSGLEAKEAVSATGAGFSITINIPQVGATPGAVIESTAIQVEDVVSLNDKSETE